MHNTLIKASPAVPLSPADYDGKGFGVLRRFLSLGKPILILNDDNPPPGIAYYQIINTTNLITVKINPRFGECYLFGVTKTEVVRILVIFHRRPMFSHINISSRRNLLSDMAEHTLILKNNRNTPWFGFPKQV